LTQSELLQTVMYNQFLTRKCRNYVELARDMCGIQAQYFNNVFYSIMIRCGEKLPSECSLNLVKTWTLRGTLHAISPSDLPIYIALAEDNAYITKCGIDPGFLKSFAEEVYNCIKYGIGDRSTLKVFFSTKINNEALLDRLFSSWGGILTLLASQGRIVFDGVDSRNFVVASPEPPMPKSTAVRLLVERYFRFYGPATLADASKFLGIKQADIKQALKDIPEIQPLKINNIMYLCFLESKVVPPIPRITYLTGFDPLLLGYKDHELVLPSQFTRNIITLTGIVKPAIMIDGKICGRWQISSKCLKIEMFEEKHLALKEELSDSGEKIFNIPADEIVFV